MTPADLGTPGSPPGLYTKEAFVSYTFRPPGEEVHFASDDFLWRRCHLGRGKSLLKSAGIYSQKFNVTEAEIAAADIVYLGGREYTVTDEEGAALTAAGYGAYLT